MNTQQKTLPSAWISMLPIIVLVLLLILSVKLFGSNSLSGGTQVALLCATAVSIGIAMLVQKTPWQTLEQGMAKTLGDSAVPIILLLLIGMMSGTWMVSGVVPTLISYGIQIMSPRFFLLTTVLISAFVSLMTGSSWTTIATIGIALLGIGNAMGISEAYTAGAIISGAYFGDKISPLSDTTILASSVAGTPLFTHIRYMFLTTTPSLVLTLIIFLIMGLCRDNNSAMHIDEYVQAIGGTFNVSAWTLIVPFITGIMIWKRLPSLIILFVASMLGAVCALILQPDRLLEIANCGTDWKAYATGLMTTLFTATNIQTGHAQVNELIATHGMAGMLDTIWLILCAMAFGGCMIASGMIESITRQIVRYVKNRVTLVGNTVFSGCILNMLTSDQYISIILTCSLFKDAYEDNGYEMRLLSRSTEDSATVTSVLVPWSSCGMTQATVLGVSTITYLPYCFFNIISPLMSILVAATGWKIVKNAQPKQATISQE